MQEGQADRITLTIKGEETFDNSLKREVKQFLVEASDGRKFVVSGQNPADVEGVDYEVLAFALDPGDDKPFTREPLIGAHTLEQGVHTLEEWLNGSGDRGWAPSPIQKLQWLAQDEGEDAALEWLNADEERQKGVIGQLFGNVEAGKDAGRPDLMLAAMLPIMELLGFDLSTMPPELREAIEKMGS